MKNTNKIWGLINIQDEYVARLNAGRKRYSGRTRALHMANLLRKIESQATADLLTLGYSKAEIPQLIQDARDTADLICICGQ